ncbi:VanW family protein [Weizmannia acidilactici]|uniref:VanW family protein n=1 Tax=Weizmannia acidilactici TaxID=2607726 RepID=UPI00124E2D73|nr:VanW family protein [Weizmannia acidilactici]GER72119.1 hypothetical protein BpPP18_01860 [Weizmannia acidilactici]
MGNKRFLKVFIILFTSTAFILGFSHFGAFAIEKGFGHTEKFSEGTSAGGVDLSGLTKDEAQQKLENAVQKWKASHPVTLLYLNQSIKLPAAELRFDLAESLNRAQDGKPGKLYVTVNNSGLVKMISESFPEISLEDWNIGQLNTAICNAASRLETGNLTFDLASYAIQADQSEKTVSKAVLTAIPEAEAYELETWAKQFPKLDIPAQSAFSLLKTAGKTGSAFSNTAMSMIATAIYEAVLPTDFEIIERYTSNELPGYAALGKEARIVKGKLDFSFVNPNTTAYKLQFAYRNGAFTVSVTGRPFAEKYKIAEKNAKTIEPKTAVRYTSSLKANQSVVKQTGRAGHYVKIYRNIYSQENSLLKSTLLSEDFYPPVTKIVSKGYPEEAEGSTSNTSGTTTGGGTSSSADQKSAAETAQTSKDDLNSSARSGNSSSDSGQAEKNSTSDNNRSGSTNSKS